MVVHDVVVTRRAHRGVDVGDRDQDPDGAVGLHRQSAVQVEEAVLEDGEVVAGMVVKLFGTNSSTVIERVEEKIASINAALPPGVQIVPYYEQKTLVSAAVRTVQSALIQGIGLVSLVIVVFLGARRQRIDDVEVLPLAEFLEELPG